eukprot:m.300920 g.300920  ORF g.300920 m.300920 type:complete len:672 (+) comp15876_c0_seq12:995-3010(+)
MQINCSYATIMSRQLDFSEPESIYPRFGTSTTDEAFEVYDLGGETGQTVPRGTRGEVAINDNQPSPPSVTTSTPSQQESRFASYGGELLYSSIPDERLYQEPQPVDRTLPVQDQVQQLEAIVSSLRNVLKQSQPLPGVPAHETKGVSPLPSLTQKPNQTFILPRLWKILCLVALFVSLASLALAVVVLTGSGSSTDSSSPSASSGLGALESKLSLLNTTFQQHLTAYNQHVSQFSSTISGLQLRVGVLESSTGSPSPSPTPSPSPPSPPSIDVQDIRDDLTNLEATFNQFQTETKHNISALSQFFNPQNFKTSFSQFLTETRRNISLLHDNLSTTTTNLSQIEQSVQAIRRESVANITRSNLQIANVGSSVDTLRQETTFNLSTLATTLMSWTEPVTHQTNFLNDSLFVCEDGIFPLVPLHTETATIHVINQSSPISKYVASKHDVVSIYWSDRSGFVEIDEDGHEMTGGWSSGSVSNGKAFQFGLERTSRRIKFVDSGRVVTIAPTANTSNFSQQYTVYDWKASDAVISVSLGAYGWAEPKPGAIDAEDFIFRTRYRGELEPLLRAGYDIIVRPTFPSDKRLDLLQALSVWTNTQDPEDASVCVMCGARIRVIFHIDLQFSQDELCSLNPSQLIDEAGSRLEVRIHRPYGYICFQRWGTGECGDMLTLVC